MKIEIKDGIVGRPIRLNRQSLSPTEGNDYAEVMFIGDVHYGSPQCDIERFQANLAYCLTHKIYVFLMGDITEVATRHSVGAGVYEQTMTADDQHVQMVEWLEPLSKANLIIGSHRGN